MPLVSCADDHNSQMHDRQNFEVKGKPYTRFYTSWKLILIVLINDVFLYILFSPAAQQSEVSDLHIAGMALPQLNNGDGARSCPSFPRTLSSVSTSELDCVLPWA